MKDSAQTLVCNTTANVYQPYPASILEIKEETEDIKTFTLKFKDKEIQENFTFWPGQFVLASLFNCGEAAFSICSSPTFSDYLQLSIKKVGLLTEEIHRYTKGDEIGLRGPYGNGFPLELLYGSNVLFVGGGIGLAPLRSLIQYLLSRRSEFGQITIFHGARTPGDIVFEEDLATWGRKEDVHVETTVYRSSPEWKGNVGPITDLWKKATISPSNTKAVVCGHPAIISYVFFDLLKMGFAEEDIISTLERNMKCEVGKCGHCTIGSKFICLDGPVFTYNKMKELSFLL